MHIFQAVASKQASKGPAELPLTRGDLCIGIQVPELSGFGDSRLSARRGHSIIYGLNFCIQGA